MGQRRALEILREGGAGKGILVKSDQLLKLMKTGRPAYWVPSPSTVARDTKTVFARTRKRIAKMLQVC